MAKRRSSADIAAEQEVLRSEAIRLAEEEGTDEEVAANIKRSEEMLAQFDELDVERLKAIDYEKKVDAVRAMALTPANRDTGGDKDKYLGDKGPEIKRAHGDPFDTDPRSLTRGEVISRAMQVIETERRVPISDGNKGYLDDLIHRSEDEEAESQFDGSYVARRVLYTENKVYRAAFSKYCRLGAMAQFNHDEQRAIAQFQEFELRRAASEGTTTAGGFGVPVKLAA